MSPVASSASNSAGMMFESFNQWVYADGTPVADQDAVTDVGNGKFEDAEGNPVQAPTAGAVASQYIQNNGITDENEQQVVYAIAGAMYQAGAGKARGAYSASPEDLAAAVSQRMTMLYPNYAKKQADIEGLLVASFMDVGPLGVKGGGGGTDPENPSLLSLFGRGVALPVTAPVEIAGALSGSSNLPEASRPPIREAVKAYMARGFDKATMKSELLRLGYPASEIDKILRSA
jgi:hypothetical protein